MSEPFEKVPADTDIAFDASAEPDMQPAPLRRDPDVDERLVRALLSSGALDWTEVWEASAAQRRTGDPMHRVLLTLGSIGAEELARAVADQLGIPFSRELEPSPEAAVSLPAPLCIRHRVLPLAVEGDALRVAMADPLDERAMEALVATTSLETRIVASTQRAVDEGLERLFSGECVDIATKALLTERPQESAFSTLSRGQRLVFGVLALAVVGGLLTALVPTLTALAAFSIVLQFASSAYRLALVSWAAGRHPELEFASDEISGLDERTLPQYTILVPLYREADVLPDLVDALRELDYPKTKLDIKLLLEQDDRGTIAAARGLDLGPPFQLLTVPHSQPKTKPKACNYGLLWARGDLVVVYDAEDRPEPDQLKKVVLAFGQLETDVACVQAKLSFWNRNQNLLTRLFTAEYAQHFDLILPGLDATNAPIPLGGTSNHFPIETLFSLGAWDPFNVTEDADLGIRLAGQGFRTAMIESTTFEEANPRPYNWTRQRSRWVKGYVQTWLVHMRQPLRLLRRLGLVRWISFQLLLGGSVLTLLLNPFYWVLTILWVSSQLGFVREFFPGFVYFAGSFNLLIGNFLFVYLNLAGLLRRGYHNLVAWALLSPFYWLLMSIGAWKGLLQLVRRPSYWEKTIHGLGRP